MIATLRRPTRHGIALFSLALASTATMAARPAAPGMTYRIRILMTPPDMPGMQMSPMSLVGHGVAIGSLSRIDIDSVTGQLPMAVGDFMLTLDSGRMVTVSPSSKTYIDGAASMMGGATQMLSQASISNVNVTTEQLGTGDTIQGYPTRKVRMTTTYVLNIMGQSMNSMNVSEMSVAQLPASVTTPFEGSMPKELLDGPMKELGEKMIAARKTLGTATALKTVNTATMSSPMLPQALTTVISIEMLDLKPADVDASMLKIPEGYTKKP